MGRFYKGQHYSTQSNLGPNERFGIEDDMSFQNLAVSLNNKKQNEIVQQDLSETNKEPQSSIDNLNEIIKKQQNEIFNLKKENEILLNEKKRI